MDLKILYRDKYLIAVEKPAGLNTESDAKGNLNLAEELKKKLSQPYPLKFNLGIIHRLDRPVSGIVLFALTPMALKKMNMLFAERKIKKKYQAIVEGIPNENTQLLIHYLYKDTLQKKAIISNEPKPNFVKVSLSYNILESFDNKAKLEIELHTGKYHQIRAQLSAIGHPILGDTLYGSKYLLAENKIMLHASYLSFIHPITLQKIQIKSLPSF